MSRTKSPSSRAASNRKSTARNLPGRTRPGAGSGPRQERRPERQDRPAGDRRPDHRTDNRSENRTDSRTENRSDRSSDRDQARAPKARWNANDRAARGPATTERSERSRSDWSSRSDRTERPNSRQDRPVRSERPSFNRDRPRNDRPGYSDDRRPSRDDRPNFRDDRRDSRSDSRGFGDDRRDSRSFNDERRSFRDEPVVHERLVAEPTSAADIADLTFADLGLAPELVTSINGMGAMSPFAIQAATIPAVLAGRDVLGRGRTGSGKTLAFGAPLVQRLSEDRARGKAKFGRAPRGLVLAPTRELAMQINRTMEPLARSRRVFTTVIVGGVPQQRQVQNLRRGVDIVIATPGRLEDLVEQGRLDLSEIEITVIDEADHMCDLGFLEPVQRILRQTSTGGQKMLYSATLDRAVESLVAEFLVEPSVHEVAGEDQESSTIDHRMLLIDQRDKVQIISELVDPQGKTLIFARTRLYAEQLAEQLTEHGLSATSLHGDLNQAKRSRNLKLLTDGRVQALVATDVAARGIHVDDIGLVIQADPPEDHKSYLHRSGRTGRAGRAGTVVTLTTRQRKRKTDRLMHDAEITATTTSARPGDQLLQELGRAEH